MGFDPRKNTLFGARDEIAADFGLHLPAPAPTVHFGREGCYTPDMHVVITPQNEPAVRRFLAALGCSQGDIDRIVASGVMRVEAKCHCRWLVFWETEAAWTLKVARLLEERHGAPLVIVCFSEHSFTTSLLSDPSDHTCFLRVVGRGQMLRTGWTVQRAVDQVNGKFRTPSQLAAHAAFAAAHGGVPMFDKHPAQGDLFTAADVLVPGFQLLAPLLEPLDGDSLFCDNGCYLTPADHAALVAPLIGYLSPDARAVLEAQPVFRNVVAAPPAYGRAARLRAAIAARGARPAQSRRPYARSEPRPLGPATARCFWNAATAGADALQPPRKFLRAGPGLRPPCSPSPAHRGVHRPRRSANSEPDNGLAEWRCGHLHVAQQHVWTALHAVWRRCSISYCCCWCS